MNSPPRAAGPGRFAVLAPGRVALGFSLLIGCTSTPAGGGGTGGRSGSGGSSASTGGSQGASSGGNASTGGSPSTGGMHGTGGSTSTGGNPGTGGNASTGGSTSTGGDASTGGSTSTGGNASAGGNVGTGGGTGGSSNGGSGPGGANGGAGGGMVGACPANAYFCSGFEDAGLPMGAKYLSSNDNDDWTKGTVLDTMHQGGKQSIEILKIGSYSQREILVPAAPDFWFRVYVRTDVAIGGAAGTMHNLFLEAMWTSGQQDKGVEVVEEDCELGVNINDSRFGSNGTTNQPGCPTAAPLGTQLPENTWHCLEGHFNGTQGDFTIYANGDPVITQTGIVAAKQAFTGLRFGYRQYHERQRLVWYDDVVTASQRIPCQ